MRSFYWIVAAMSVFVACLFIADPKDKFAQDEQIRPILEQTLSDATAFMTNEDAGKPPRLREVMPTETGQPVRAAGVVRGASDPIYLRSLVPEKITEVLVEVGDRVTRGQLLVRLADKTLRAPRDAAAAELEVAQAALDELNNGARQSEIDALRALLDESQERFRASTSRLERTRTLFDGDASSREELDNAIELQKTLRAQVQSAEARLKTLTDPPRPEQLRAAEAAVRAARSRLESANARLEHTRVVAPTDGVILGVEAAVGEVAWPEDPTPLVEMVDDRSRRILAEVDEYDAIRVRPGQTCEVTCDAATGTVATGTVDIVWPGMRGKTIRGEWAGERNDTHVRPVWIRLDDAPNLPIGLPVEVTIQTALDAAEILEESPPSGGEQNRVTRDEDANEARVIRPTAASI